MSMYIGVSGLKAATTDLNTTSQNVANASTTGFKFGRTEFGDLVDQNAAMGGGLGVKTQAINQQFQQGSITTTGNPLDMAITGNGFFQVTDSSGTYYTRAGSFHADADGFVVNNLGQNLQGSKGSLQISNAPLAGSATTQVNFGINLNAAESNYIDTTAATFDVTDNNHYSTSVEVFDALGVKHTVASYFVRSITPADPTTTPPTPAKPADSWDVYFAIDGDTTPATVNATKKTLAFDPKTGLITGTSSFDLTVNSAVIPIDFSTALQFGDKYSAFDINSEGGHAMGLLTGFDMDEKGNLYGIYDNGETLLLDQVSLVKFANNQGLKAVGDTNWVATAQSGAALPGNDTSNIMSGALEASNVDLTDQLVNMIIAQRNFQANSKTITTNQSLTETVTNMIR